MGKIGLFDSGFGGLVLMHDIANRLPTHDFVYFGDTAHNPYSSRSADEIRQLTARGVSFLFSQDCDIVVILCNSSDSNALASLQQNLLPALGEGKFLIGSVAPSVAAAAVATKNKRIGVIATEATINSGNFQQQLDALQTGAQLYQQACPMLVPLIEAGQQAGISLRALLKTYLAPLQAQGIDTLILGCAHYGLIRQQIQDVLGSAVTLVNEGPVVAANLADFLARHPELESRLTKNSLRQFYCGSEGKKAFDLIGSEFYGTPISATQVTI